MRPVLGAEDAAAAQLGRACGGAGEVDAVVLTHVHIDHSGYLSRFVRQGFGGPGGFRLRLKPAGHILGASIATLSVGGVKVVFPGDLGRMRDCIMHPPSPIEDADYLIVESTYGKRRHDQADAEETLAAHLGRALAPLAHN